MSTTDTDVRVPIFAPPTAGDVPRTVVVPVVTPHPIASPPVPRHPHMAPNGCSNMHNDAYMSDSYTWPGPAGGTLQIMRGRLDGLCATLTFTRESHIVTVSAAVTKVGVKRELLLLDGKTLEVLARTELPGGGISGSGFGSGGYIYLDQIDRPVVPTADQTVVVYKAAPPSFIQVAAYNVAPAIGNAQASIQSALPDWKGRIWFVTNTGCVGYVDPVTSQVRAMQLDEPEEIGNSFAVDETGGVFVVSNYAQYRFDVGPDGAPTVTWRCTYDRGSRMKPGQVNFGSGTTPTLIGQTWLGITDNADPRMNVVVYHREKEWVGDRLAAQIPVFTPGRSDTENSLIAAGDTFIVENNYGYTGTYNTPTTPVTPGLARVAWPGGGFGKTVWFTQEVTIPTVVSKVSLADGLVYTYALKQNEGRMDWYVTAAEAATGKVAWEVYAGSGIEFDNRYAGLFVGPDGTVYVPVWSGIVSVRQA